MASYSTHPSSRLIRLAAVLPEGGTTQVGDIVDRLGRTGLGFLVLILTVPALIPIPGPFGMVFGSALALVALQMMANVEHFWLPQRVRQIPVSSERVKSAAATAAKWLRPLESWLKPRRVRHFALPDFRPVFGIPVFILAVAIALPIPMGNVLPCLALMLLALGMIVQDGVAVVAGLIVGAMALAWDFFLFIAGAEALVWLRHFFF